MEQKQASKSYLAIIAILVIALTVVSSVSIVYLTSTTKTYNTNLEQMQETNSESTKAAYQLAQFLYTYANSSRINIDDTWTLNVTEPIDYFLPSPAIGVTYAIVDFSVNIYSNGTHSASNLVYSDGKATPVVLLGLT